MGFYAFGLGFDAGGEAFVIVIEKCDEITAGVIDDGLAGGGGPLVCFVLDECDVFVFVDDCDGVIGGAIIDDDDFGIGVVLVLGAFDGAGDGVLRVVTGDADCDFGFIVVGHGMRGFLGLVRYLAGPKILFVVLAQGCV